MKWNAKKNYRRTKPNSLKGIIDKTGRFIKYVSPVELKKDISILLYNSYYYSESNQHRISNVKHLNQFHWRIHVKPNITVSQSPNPNMLHLHIRKQFNFKASKKLYEFIGTETKFDFNLNSSIVNCQFAVGLLVVKFIFKLLLLLWFTFIYV